MSHHEPNRAIVEPDTALSLGNGWQAITAIGTDGTSWPWLLSPDTEHALGCCCHRCAPHEALGPLPAAILDRLHRCGAPTRTGAPCRRRTSSAGRCALHTQASTP